MQYYFTFPVVAHNRILNRTISADRYFCECVCVYEVRIRLTLTNLVSTENKQKNIVRAKRVHIYTMRAMFFDCVVCFLCDCIVFEKFVTRDAHNIRELQLHQLHDLFVVVVCFYFRSLCLRSAKRFRLIGPFVC